MMKKFFMNSPIADQSVCGDNLRKVYLRPESEVVPVGYALMFTTSLNSRQDYVAGGDPFEEIDIEDDVDGLNDYVTPHQNPFDSGTGNHSYSAGGDPFSYF